MISETVARKSDTRLETIERRVVLSGIRPIMFDRYAGDNDTKLAWTEKIYLKPGTSELCIPAININSFYTAHNTPSAPKRLRDKRKYKDICNAIQSFVIIDALDGGEYLPLLRDGKVITVGKFEEDHDPLSGLYLHRSVARLDKGIPNPKERPTLPLEWSLEFRLRIFKNNAIKEAEIRNLTIEGGLAIGLGTYRGQFGKFVEKLGSNTAWRGRAWLGWAWRGLAGHGRAWLGGAGRGRARPGRAWLGWAWQGKDFQMNQTQFNFDGDTYSPAHDKQRLNTALGKVWLLMQDGNWRTLAMIAKAVGCSEAGVSARLRDLRKPRFSFTYPNKGISSRRGLAGLWWYRLEK